jgi:hypothetical protein
VAFLIVFLVMFCYWIMLSGFRRTTDRRFRDAFVRFLQYSFVAAIVFGMWYGIETLKNGPWFVWEFTKYQWDLLVRPGAGHAGFPGYHVVVLLFGCFPASILALQPLFRKTDGTDIQRNTKLWMIILVIVVLVLFSIVQSKIVHYSSLCYFPITFLATLYIWNILQAQEKIGVWQKLGLSMIAFLYLVTGILLVGFGQNPDAILGYVEDENALASISMDVGWSWWHVFPIIFLLGFMITIAGTSRKNSWYAVILMHACTALFAWSAILVWVGKIQQYTQGPATEFFNSLSGKEVYVIPWGHKSYSQYWDFRKPPPEGFSVTDSSVSLYMKYSDPDYLLNEQNEKDVHVITKASKSDEFQSRYPHVKRTGEKGGFVFFVREVLE